MTLTRKKILLATLPVACVSLACGHGSNFGPTDATVALRPTASPMKDPLVQYARLVQQVPSDDREYGVEPGGGVRALASGVRLVNLPNGAVMSADETLPSLPKVVEVPDRMGGGFLFLLGANSNQIWRADHWLGHARPLFDSAEPLSTIIVGLDRVYLESKKGSEQAIDPRTGAMLDLGAWPPTPNVGAYAAMDGWRAVAIADLRGVVATFDAGASWHPLPIPLDASRIEPFSGGVVVSGVDAAHAPASYEVRLDGQVARLATPTASASPNNNAPDLTAKPFGDRPLVAAVEDGWPLTDGTVVVARDGALARIRLEDGVITELASNAYPLRPSRCHAIAFGDGAGFVCGEPRGRTAIYRYENGKMIEARRFDSPRLVLASGSGAVAIRGGCSPSAEADPIDTNEQSYCVLPKTAAASPEGIGAREVHLRGNVDQERVAVLSNGKLVVVSPPHGDIANARITVVDPSGATHTSPIVFAAETPRESLRILRSGLWLDGIEERRPGVLGGWAEKSKSMLGFEIELDGHATAGAYVADLGEPIVSGKFGLGWRAYETMDGGMTWKTMPTKLPEPIATCPRERHDRPVNTVHSACVPSAQSERSCGPIGCVSQGWMRIGWGTRPPAAPEKALEGPATHYPSQRGIALTCEPTGPAPSLARVVVPPLPTAAMTQAQLQAQLQQGPGGLGGMFGPNPNQAPSQWRFRNQQVLTTLDWTPFFSAPAPTLRADDIGYSLNAGYTAAPVGELMRFYAWGARGIEWEHTSRWVVRWLSPFSSSNEVHSTQPSAAPQVVLDSSKFASSFGGVQHGVQSWTMVAGDDPQHALLIARRTAPQDTIVLALEADRPPVEIRRSDGESFDEIDAAIRMRGRWFLLADSETLPQAGVEIWEADGATAHEFVSIPRSFNVDRSAQTTRLAARSDGRAIGLIVDGQPLATRPNSPIRWALSIAADDATIGSLEPIGVEDFADKSNISMCSGDEAGWVFDVPWPAASTGSVSPVPIQIAIHGTMRPLRAPYARIRATGTAVCIDRLAGTMDAPPEILSAKTRSNLSHVETQSIEVAAITAHLHYGLRCWQTP